MDEQLFEQFNSSITENFFQESTIDAFSKYAIVEETGEGEFGKIYKVKPNEVKDPSSVRVYCLKTIHLNRVSHVDEHQEEIKNEISALKVCFLREAFLNLLTQYFANICSVSFCFSLPIVHKQSTQTKTIMCTQQRHWTIQI